MNKKLLLLPLSALFVLMMAGLVSAAVACTFDQTATTAGTSSSYLRALSGDLTNLSASVTGPTGGQNITDGVLSNDITGTLYYFNSTSDVNVSQVSNKSVDLGEFLDTQVVTFTWTLNNVSRDTVATCNRAYIVDLTTPGCIYASGLVSGTEYAPNQKWTVACTNSSSATIQFGNNNPLAMAEAADSCTFTGDKSKVPEGSYQALTVTTSDGLNTSSCGLTGITIDIGIPLKQIAALAADGSLPKASSGNASSSNTAMIVIIGLAALWYIRRKKK